MINWEFYPYVKLGKFMGKFYAVKIGRETGIFLTWDECAKNVNKYPGAVYKSFKTRDEAENFLRGPLPSYAVKLSSVHDSVSNEINSKSASQKKSASGHASKNTVEKTYYSFYDLGSYYPSYSDAIKRKSEILKNEKGYPVPLPCESEAKALADGRWEEYLKENIIPFSFEDGLDAICFSDGSYDEEINFEESLELAGKSADDKAAQALGFKKYSASFGLIIFLKTGEKIIESGRINSISETESLRSIFDENGKEKFTDKIITAPSKYGYVRSGMAETAECEGGLRVLQICAELGLKKIRFVVDADNIPNAIKYYNVKKDASSLPIKRLAGYYSENKIVISDESFRERIRSHRAYEVKDKLFLFSAMNDCCDLLAKAELPVKTGANIRKDNPNILRIVSDPDGHFRANPELSGLSELLKTDSEEERRTMTRDILGRLFPVT